MADQLMHHSALTASHDLLSEPVRLARLTEGTDLTPVRLEAWTGPQAAVRPDLTFALVETMAKLEALEPEWNDLMARAGRPEHVFQTFAWIWHWGRHYLPAPGTRGGARLAVVTGRVDGELSLILPLVVTRRGGLRTLTWAGEPVSQYNDAIATPACADADTLEAAFRFAARATRAHLAFLRKVREGAVAAPLFARLDTRVTLTEEAPAMRLDGAPDYVSYEATRPSKLRKNRRRHQRRLEERGPISFEIRADCEDAGRLADYAVIMKRASLDGRGHIAPALADPRFAAFFGDAARGLGRPTGTRVLALRSEGEITAMQIVIDHAGARFLHVAVFSPKFEKCGAGGLLLERATADCFDRGIHTFDMLAPKHAYKMEFADEVVPVNDHAIVLGRTGALYVHAVLGLRPRAKKALEAMPAPVRRFAGSLLALARRGR